jgi:hypothetical protein
MPSWRRSLLLALAVAVLLPAAARAQAPPVETAPAEPPAARAPAPGPAELEAVAGPLFHRLAALRGLAAPGDPPPIVARSREETRRFMEQELDRRYGGPRVEAERKGMAAWGLIPGDYDLRGLFLDLLQEQVAAYYDPRARVMAIGSWLRPEQQEAALLHEMVHALQDREIPLAGYLAVEPGKGDQLLARQALIEGEAVALSLDLLLRAQGLDLATIPVPDLGSVRAKIAAASAGPAISAAPPFLRELLIFPYVEGLHFVHQARRRQPWSAMSALYLDPPRSTAQILHPEKRLDRREDPVAVALPDLGPALPTAGAVTEDELGELALGAVLGLHLGAEAGRRAAVGWRGDRYRVWEPEPGRFALAYVLVVDGEERARAVAAALAGVVEKRHAATAGRARTAGGLVTWADGASAWAVEHRGAEVLLMDAVPAAALDRARDALWASRHQQEPASRQPDLAPRWSAP